MTTEFIAEDLQNNKPRRLKFAIQDESQLADIAERSGVKQLLSLSVEAEAMRQGDGCRIHLTGTLSAQMKQDCVTTLEDMTTQISGVPFDAWFIDDESVVSFQSKKLQKQQDQMSKMDGEAGEKHMLEEQEAPEPIINGKIDVLEAAVQFLILSVNPFPHSDSEGKPFEYREFSKDSPFASLAGLKQNTETS